jgi:hypothetical protein
MLQLYVLRSICHNSDLLSELHSKNYLKLVAFYNPLKNARFKFTFLIIRNSNSVRP